MPTLKALTLLFTVLLSTLAPPRPEPAPRLGFSIAWQRGDVWAQQSLALLHPPAWKNWQWDHAGDPTYIPEVYTMQPSPTADAAMAAARATGGVWILGSEPELDQTYTDPEVAAAFSQAWQTQVGGSWGAPGIITWEAGYNWLERYLAAGGLAGTHWHIHVYDVYQPGDWTAKWQEWRAWMKTHNLERPTIVSETAGWDATVDQALILDEIATIQRTDPLLETVLWYSDTDYWQLWPYADLRTGTDLTPLGHHYLDLQAP